ncbi:MAG: hypothetical protein PHI99_02430 [Syntrophales bacterium]|nr:hypothetical protein [Syntrophales bacterium]
MTKARHKKNPEAIKDVLLKSKRRCCICFGLMHNHEAKRGQVAHLDRDRANGSPDNLVFLCLDHHDEYDSTTSQSKSLQISEVKAYREQLYKFLASGKVQGGETSKKSEKTKSSKPFSARTLNAFWRRSHTNVATVGTPSR